MPEEILISHCSPTLAGLKTANMITLKYPSREEMTRDLRCINHRLHQKGVRVIPLRWQNGTALIYIYRPAKLSLDLQDKLARKIMHDHGYTGHTPEACLRHLKERLSAGKDFPHEIGLFLGYPSIDVQGFIENKAQNSICTGVWKVYSNPESALKAFSRFQKCTRIYHQKWNEGSSLEKLTVRTF